MVELGEMTQKSRFTKLSKSPVALSAFKVPLHDSRSQFRHHKLNSDLADLCPVPFSKTDVPLHYSF